MRGVLQLFHKRSKDLFWNCSRTKLICSRTVLGKTFRIFWNFSRTNFLTLARTIVEQIKALRVLMETMSCDFSSCRLSRVHFCR